MGKTKSDDVAATLRLTVCTAAAQGEAARYRAGLGPFGREAVTLEVAPEQAQALRADPMLVVSEAGEGG